MCVEASHRQGFDSLRCSIIGMQKRDGQNSGLLPWDGSGDTRYFTLYKGRVDVPDIRIGGTGA